jgi:hypothetical protein
MCGAFGMLGATIAAMRRYYRTLITERAALAEGKSFTPADWTLGWIYYYLTRPLLGGLLGAFTYMFSYAGLLVLATPRDTQVSSEGRFALYALALIAGFAVSHVLDRIEAVARQTFKTHKN